MTLVKVKFAVFRDIASCITTEMFPCQVSNVRLVPFLADELERLMRDIMRYLVTKSSLESASTPYKLCNIGFKGGNCLPISDIKFRTAVN